MEKRPIAYQLYSAREEAERDFIGLLKKVKAMGFQGVEFAGFFGLSAPELRKHLDDIGLVAVSSHVPLEAMEADPFGVLAYHEKLGCRHVVVPYLPEDKRPGTPAFAKVIRFIHWFGALAKQAGIVLLYHNHDFEFVPFSGGTALDFLYAAVPTDILQTEIDTCWVKYAGVEPAAYLLKYKGRAPLVHLKDFVGFKGDKSPYHLIGQKENPDANIAQFSYRPYGYGVQDVESLTKAAIEAGAKWLIIEEDESPDRPPLEASRMSIETLRKLGV